MGSVVSPSEGDRVEKLRRPRWLEFSGQGTRETGCTERESELQTSEEGSHQVFSRVLIRTCEERTITFCFGSSEVKRSLTGLKSRCQQGCVPSGGSRGESAALPFPSQGCLQSLAHGPLPETLGQVFFMLPPRGGLFFHLQEAL